MSITAHPRNNGSMFSLSSRVEAEFRFAAGRGSGRVNSYQPSSSSPSGSDSGSDPPFFFFSEALVGSFSFSLPSASP